VAKILVADDNSNIQKMVGLALKDQGIDVVAVGNGEAAVRKISDLRPDLVLADVFMPVRNGYEVCRYVKENAALSRIPVILLVGAFDPLDEQEAQRVGADGVLKKPFVPPDPLISMVKSALSRAGVSLGSPPAAEKQEAAPQRPATESVAPALSSKLAAFPTENFPEVAPEPVEEFAAPREQVKIAAGSQPLAFGNLLDTKEDEDVAILSTKPMIEIAKDRKWTDERDDVPEEEDEEETSGNDWRAGGIDEQMERAAASATGQKDWREEAFKESSPAKSIGVPRWAAPSEQPAMVEAAPLPSAAVSTLEFKPATGTVPFASDAWAATLAAHVGNKVEELKDSAPAAHEVEEPAAEKNLSGSAAPAVASVQAEPAVAEAQPVEPGNWATIPESSWETEAKRASMLASTWDAAPIKEAEAAEEVTRYVPEAPVSHAEHAIMHEEEQPAEPSAYSGHSELHVEGSGHTETPEIEQPVEAAVETTATESLERPWEAPIDVQPAATVEEEHIQHVKHVEPPQVVEHMPEPEPAPVEEPVVAQAAQPDMDELISKVLGKMNPEVLQKVTREILKPVVEALIRDELNSKKS
jgi:CheY-like chemotaxis protein